ncbi:DUF3592 domain-containing protein [Bifidobacterium vansinderenii]|uniref:DUF3592 domain-containing protein n=1 Tax=Bifidobacterium vansinderenii TaxID=1984871 RepID=A0A229VZ52_9BIFI|nr:DUF3592 domain-containing protein [Bifidobacterium vansinderenii]OXN00885.1 hypothetical protein Tam10B_0841 [Bifidobacterium vansinderenii]
MTHTQITILLLATLGLPGLALLIVGIAVIAVQRGKARRCTAVTTGWVIDYRFPGGDQFYPVIGYQVDGRGYKVNRRFRGYVTTSKITPLNPYVDSGAYVSDRDVLHMRSGMVTNYRTMAQQLWPQGSTMPVYYDPANPAHAFAQRVPNYTPPVGIIFTAFGAAILLATIPMAFVLLA